MSLTKNQLQELLEVAKSAAIHAGKVIEEHQGRAIKINKKNGGENFASQVVTEVDLKAESSILDKLDPTIQKYKLGLLTEEMTDDQSRFQHDYFWCVDPLDGTLAFSQNEAGYSTSIALVTREGEAVIGVVYDPRQKSLYFAQKGQGAYKNGSQFKVTNKTKTLTLLYDQSYQNHPQLIEHLEEIQNKLPSHRFEKLVHFQLGGAVMNAISTIEQAPALYYKIPKKRDGGGSLWDFAASSIIHKEAGGFNSNYQKKPLNLNQKGSTFMNQQGVIFMSSPELSDFVPSCS